MMDDSHPKYTLARALEEFAESTDRSIATPKG
jgi:hypothetical protein